VVPALAFNSCRFDTAWKYVYPQGFFHVLSHFVCSRTDVSRPGSNPFDSTSRTHAREIPPYLRKVLYDTE
jgi:hypothetical protein